jgi:hypothetical protein
MKHRDAFIGYVSAFTELPGTCVCVLLMVLPFSALFENAKGRMVAR